MKGLRWKFLLLMTGVLLAVPGPVQAEQGVVTVTITINPLVVALDAPAEVTVGKPFHVTAEVENRGDGKLYEVSATLGLPSGLALRQGTLDSSLGTVTKQRRATWQLEATEEGTFAVTVIASGRDEKGNPLTSQTSAPVNAVPATPSGRPSSSTSVLGFLIGKMLSLVGVATGSR